MRRGGSRSKLCSFKREAPRDKPVASKLRFLDLLIAATVKPPRDKPVASLWLESGIDGFALEGEYAEDAFVNAANRLLAYEALEGLDAEREFSEGE